MSSKNDPERTFTLDELREAIRAEQQPDLEPCTVTEAIDMYLSEKSDEYRETTEQQYISSLGFFRIWCHSNGIENLNDLSARQLKEYKNWRRDEATTKVKSLSKATLKSQMDILRCFLRLCETSDAVEPGLHEAVPSIELESGEGVRNEKLDSERATDIRDYLSKFKYASREHVVWVLFTETGVRVSGLHSLDVEDYYPDADIPHLRLRHRPETGTRLKNGTDGNRKIGLREGSCEVLEDYIGDARIDVEGQNGRNPLVTSHEGRVSRSTIRKYVYMWTRPCAIGKECPHGVDPNECDAVDNNSAYECPSSQSAHTLRRGYITHKLNSDVDPTYLSGRVDTSVEVLKEHYDARTETEKMEVRQRILDASRLDNDEYGGE